MGDKRYEHRKGKGQAKPDQTDNYVDKHLGSGMARDAADSVRSRSARIDAAVAGSQRGKKKNPEKDYPRLEEKPKSPKKRKQEREYQHPNHETGRGGVIQRKK